MGNPILLLPHSPRGERVPDPGRTWPLSPGRSGTPPPFCSVLLLRGSRRGRGLRRQGWGSLPSPRWQHPPRWVSEPDDGGPEPPIPPTPPSDRSLICFRIKKEKKKKNAKKKKKKRKKRKKPGAQGPPVLERGTPSGGQRPWEEEARCPGGGSWGGPPPPHLRMGSSHRNVLYGEKID